MSISLAPDEPLSPELVLVLPAELRAQVLAGLGPPVQPLPPLGVLERSTTAPEPPGPSLGAVVASRVARLGLVFVAITIVTVALSLVAQALR